MSAVRSNIGRVFNSHKPCSVLTLEPDVILLLRCGSLRDGSLLTAVVIPATAAVLSAATHLATLLWPLISRSQNTGWCLVVLFCGCFFVVFFCILFLAKSSSVVVRELRQIAVLTTLTAASLAPFSVHGQCRAEWLTSDCMIMVRIAAICFSYLDSVNGISMIRFQMVACLQQEEQKLQVSMAACLFVWFFCFVFFLTVA